MKLPFLFSLLLMNEIVHRFYNKNTHTHTHTPPQFLIDFFLRILGRLVLKILRLLRGLGKLWPVDEIWPAAGVCE